MIDNPIAVVHWLQGGVERSRPTYTQRELERVSKQLKRENAVHWICLCGAAPPGKRTVLEVVRKQA